LYGYNFNDRAFSNTAHINHLIGKHTFLITESLFLCMFSFFLNWRNILALIAIVIVSGTIFYSQYLTKKIAADERKKVRVWAESLKTKSTTVDPNAINLTNIIANENNDIPIIETDEQDLPTGNFLNLDAQKTKKDSLFLINKVREFKRLHQGIRVDISAEPLIFNTYYYGNSDLLNEVEYYPLVQLLIVSLFIVITLILIQTSNKSTQNQVWAGMAKEAAHQLGTPISSIEGWIEVLKNEQVDPKKLLEISKDVDRLKLVSDRFGKIGSIPKLEPAALIPLLEQMIEYIKKRSSDKVKFELNSMIEPNLQLPLNTQLFDWVIENVLKNALDAMEGKGEIKITVLEEKQFVKIDVQDSGKGLLKRNWEKIFKPGYSTKKRGWGLGLSLSKRIVEQYHQGEIFVKNSEIGKGTCIRISMKKSST
jgi:signal transduction histidine kinase